MNRFIPNTIFARLFSLVLAAIVLSHILTTLLLIQFDGPHHFMPPPPGDLTFGASPHSPPPDSPPFNYPPSDGPHAPHVPPGYAPPHRMPTSFLVGQIVQFFAVALAAWFGARFVARPIQDLADAASQLGENIDNSPIEERGPAEARKAARIFNRMQQQIRAQLAERNRFLAAVSHDLRTPLTRMRLRVAHLTDDEHDKHKLNEDIAEMAAMLDATLNYLRGEAPEPWQRLDIQALLESMAEDARDSGRVVTLSGSAQPIVVQPLSLRRCLANLLDNALQYGDQAELSITDNSDRVVIEVRDHGPGIPENKMNAVFEPFVRLETSRNKNTGGVGLGLAIAREAALRNGGEIELRNAPGGGLIARLSIPRRRNV